MKAKLAKAPAIGATHGSRIEKPERPKKTQRELPKWYFRVLGKYYDKMSDPPGYEFDEDLSDLEVTSKPPKVPKSCDCDCDSDGEDSECDCQYWSDSDEESMSERSYDGDDADCYYEFKDIRKERKMELLEGKRRKEERRRMEEAKEEEVRLANKALKRARRQKETIPIDNLASTSFKLFCSRHVDYFYDWNNGDYATKRIDFYHLDEEGNDIEPQAEGILNLDVDIYFDGNASCSFGTFKVPKRSRRKYVELISNCGDFHIAIRFIGNGYLKVKVPRDLVFKGHKSPPADAPGIFEFFGILQDLDKEKEERVAATSSSDDDTGFDGGYSFGGWNIGW